MINQVAFDYEWTVTVTVRKRGEEGNLAVSICTCMSPREPSNDDRERLRLIAKEADARIRQLLESHQ